MNMTREYFNNVEKACKTPSSAASRLGTLKSLHNMKRFLIAIALLLSAIPLGAQRIPFCLDNPASKSIEHNYGVAYGILKSSYYGFGTGIGMAAVGGGLMLRTNYLANKRPDGMNEGAGIAMIFEGMLVAAGVTVSTGAIAQNLLARAWISNITEKNDFLNTPGEDLGSWERYRTSRVYDSSKKWMKVSGITAGCLSAYTCVGVIGCMYSDSEFLYHSTDAAMWLSFASCATYLVSWMVNTSSKYKLLDIEPSLTYMPATGCPAAGLCLTARF